MQDETVPSSSFLPENQVKIRRGVRLGIDLGEVRIGVAKCDCEGLLATPVETVYRADGAEIFDIVDIVEEYNAFEIIVGLPKHLNGEEGKNARDVRQWSQKLVSLLPNCNVRLVDERLTTVSAHASLRSAGVKGRKQRKVVDQQAAVFILEQALEIERRTGQAAGVLVS